MDNTIKDLANKLIRDEPLSDTDLREIVNVLELDSIIPFNGIHRLNHIPDSFYTSKDSFVIVNLDSKSDGTHWVGMIRYSDGDGAHIIYYDSFGMDVPQVIIDDIQSLDIPMKVYSSSVQKQPIDSNRCGWYIIQFFIDILIRREGTNDSMYNELRSLETYWMSVSKNDEKRTEILEKRLIADFMHIFDEML